MAREAIEETTDEKLLERYIEGRDERAFAVLVKRHGSMVLATAHRVLRNSADVEEAFQATFLALAKVAGKLRHKAGVGVWLHRTAERCARLIQRNNDRWSRGVELMSEQLESTTTTDKETMNEPSKRAANEELEAILDEEIARLPEKLRAAIVFCDLEGLTRKQAAKQLGLTQSTVTDYVTKARQLLCERLIRRGVTISLGGLAAYFTSSTGPAISAQLVSDTARQAVLFAAGQTATDLGVSSTVINTANQVISTMKKAKLTAIGLAVLAIVTLMGAVAGTFGLTEPTARAGYIFQETFDDGNFADGSPITWTQQPLAKGIIDASSGDFVFTGNDDTDITQGTSVSAFDEVHKNTSTRAIVRVTDQGAPNWGATILARSQTTKIEDFYGYFATVMYVPSFGGNVMFMGTGSVDDDGVVSTVPFNSVAGPIPYRLSFNLRKVDTAIQLDVFGNQIKAWAWPANEEMPAEPAFDIIDDSITEEGYVSIGMSSRAPVGGPKGNGQVIFRDVKVADMPIHEIVPEPSTAALSSLAFAALATLVWRRRD